MKRWRVPARELPVRLRPFGGETIPSYTRRLAAANDLSPTAILRTIGDIYSAMPSMTLMHSKDVVLNDAAKHRLETLTAIPRARLRQALPALSRVYHRQLPTDRPAIAFQQLYPRPRPACTTCVTRRATKPAQIHLDARTMICRPHRRWLIGGQHDLRQLPSVLHAFHRYRTLLDDHADDLPWITTVDRITTGIIAGWRTNASNAHAELRHRWNLRGELLGIDVGAAADLITLPEKVALLAAISNPTWRRHLALQPNYAHRPFYANIANTTGANEKD